MKVLHVVEHLHKLSGVSCFCNEVTDALREQGIDVVVALSRFSDQNQLPSRCNVQRMNLRNILNGTLKSDWDIIHIHNLWTMTQHRSMTWAYNNDTPVVWSLHGTLSPWAFRYKWWKKLIPWHLYQKSDLRAASVIHVTSSDEEKWVRDAGFAQEVVTIPLGTTLPESIPVRHGPERTLLFVGRITPVKALPNLLGAWAMVRPVGWKLRIVGVQDFDGYTDYLKAQCDRLGISASIEFPGQRFGEDLLGEYADASALILPSHNENFGAVVIDALAWGMPVITSTGTPWQEVEKVGCGWWVDNTSQKLAETLKGLMSLSDDERHTMGVKGRRYVAERYTWQSVALEMKGVYESLLQR